MSTALVVIGIVAVAVVVVWFFVNRRNPENAASHRDPDRPSGDEAFHDDPGGRPAGPGAEDERVVRPGEPGPGPSAEAGGGPGPGGEDRQ